MHQPDSSCDYRAATASARERLDEVRAWVEEFAADISSDHTSSLIYVFDTDVITMYSSPTMRSNYSALLRSEASARKAMAARLDGMPGTDLDECELALADLMGNHIIWGRQQAALNSPVHADELALLCIQIWLAAEKQLPALYDRLRVSFATLKKSYPDDADEKTKRSWIEEHSNSTLKKLESEAPDFLRALRLQQAFKGDRIYSIEGHRLNSGNLAEHKFLPSA